MCTLYFNLIYFKREYIILLNWVGSLPECNSFFLNDTFQCTFCDARRGSLLAIKFVFATVASSAIAITILFPLLSYIVNQEDYTLPAAIYLPFLPPTNLACYFINLVHQAYVLYCALIWGFIFVNIIFTILIHAWIHLEAIKVLVGNMKEGIATKNYQDWLKLVLIELADAKHHK